MTELRCSDLAAVDAELALGVADARTRAAAVAHLERCPACRRRVRDLSDVADLLVELVPPAQPPAGFESQVLARVEAGGSDAGRRDGHRTGQRRRRWALAAAAVAAAVLLGVGGWWVGSTTGTSTTRARHTVTASLVRHHEVVGQVVVVGGADPWLSMSMRTGAGVSTVRCQVRVAGGRLLTLGTYPVTGGYGYWAAPLPPGTSVRSVRVVGSSGAVVGTAVLARSSG